MCYLLNASYGCTSRVMPGARPSHLHSPHQTRTSVLCSSTDTCPANLWETRTQRWDTLCPNCTGDDLPREPPLEDRWLPASDAAHATAAGLYLRDLVGGLLNGYVAAFTPSATPRDFHRRWPRLHAESLCRVHGEPPRSCGCSSGAPATAAPRVWEYNMATDLRARAAASATDAFLSNAAVACALATPHPHGPMPDLIQASARRTLGLPRASDDADAGSTRRGARKPQQPHIWAHHDPARAVPRAALFSESESSRRLDFSLSALDAALEAIRSVTAHLPTLASHAALEGSRYRAQVSRAFSLPVVVDPGLSPRRADEVLARLATLALDPTFFREDVPPEFDETLLLVGAQMGHLARSAGAAGGVRNPAVALHARFAEHVVWMRRTLQVELERAVALRIAFEASAELDEDGERAAANCPCPLRGCDRRAAREGEMEDPRVHHVETARVAVCGHVVARRCLFLAGAETAREDGGFITWRCPVCGKDGAWVRYVGNTETETSPWTAMMEGELDRVIHELQ